MQREGEESKERIERRADILSPPGGVSPSTSIHYEIYISILRSTVKMKVLLVCCMCLTMMENAASRRWQSIAVLPRGEYLIRRRSASQSVRYSLEMGVRGVAVFTFC